MPGIARLPTAASMPDWIIFGLRRRPGDGVCVYASKTLREVTLRMEWEMGTKFMPGTGLGMTPEMTRVELSAVMRDYVFCIAPTYIEAMVKVADLFREWEREWGSAASEPALRAIGKVGGPPLPPTLRALGSSDAD